MSPASLRSPGALRGQEGPLCDSVLKRFSGASRIHVFPQEMPVFLNPSELFGGFRQNNMKTRLDVHRPCGARVQGSPPLAPVPKEHTKTKGSVNVC